MAMVFPPPQAMAMAMAFSAPQASMAMASVASAISFTRLRPCVCFSTPAKTSSSLPSSLLSFIEDVIVSSEPRPFPRSSDPSLHLSGPFCPLPSDSPPTPCLITSGSLPDCLNGAYLRNGPNPLLPPRSGYHPFDGDGMLHCVRILHGLATHSCRFTETNRYVHEKAAGQPLFTKALGELNGLPGLAKLTLLQLRHVFGVIDVRKGFGPANAGLVFFNGKLLAMSEDDMPYEVWIAPNGDLRTVGRFNFSGQLRNAMTAHPKIDRLTGEMFSFSYNLLQQPYLRYFRVSSDGKKGKDIPITLSEPTLIHDFAITQRYAVFPEHQIVFRLQDMFMGRSPIVCDANKVPRVGILPRYDNDESKIKWFELPGCTCFHYLNAWEENDEVVLIGSINVPVEVIFENPEKLQCRLHEFRFNMRTGKASKQQISSANIDVGRINEEFTGRKNRYVYMCTSGPWPDYSGVAKVDLQAPRLPARPSLPGKNTGEPCIVGWRNFGEGCHGSEPFFVPKSTQIEDEDDGYVLAFVHNDISNQSELLVMDAKSPTLATIACVQLACRVPSGFHGLFVSEQQLQQQRKVHL